MVKLILIVTVSISFLISFYNWGVYAYNAKQATINVKWVEDLNKRNVGSANEEKIENITELKVHQICWNISKNEWFLKLIFDLLILILLVIFLKKSNNF